LRYTEDTTSVFFVEWFGKSFVKPLPEVTTAIRDNASSYPKNKLKNLARRHGIKLLFLPPYSPGFNPI
jgi:transposase